MQKFFLRSEPKLLGSRESSSGSAKQKDKFVSINNLVLKYTTALELMLDNVYRQLPITLKGDKHFNQNVDNADYMHLFVKAM